MVIRETDVLLVVDVQNDFCPGGRLAVERGDEVVPVINALMERFKHVVLTQDWHPVGHISFASVHAGKKPFEEIEVAYGYQRLWPDHCLQGTEGAAFHVGLKWDRAEMVVRKGWDSGIDSYSAFLENDKTTHTGLAGYLRERGVTRVFLCGLAYDYCVHYSGMDGTRLGFECVVVTDACRGIGIEGSIERAEREMDEAGVRRVVSGRLVSKTLLP